MWGEEWRNEEVKESLDNRISTSTLCTYLLPDSRKLKKETEVKENLDYRI